MSMIKQRITLRLSSRSNVSKSRAAIFGRHAIRNHSHAQILEENIERYTQDGYHPVRIGDEFRDGRYQVISKLGFGAYSTVWLVRDKRSNTHKALKVLTADTYGKGANPFELEILRHLKTTDTSNIGAQHVLELLDHFTHRGPHGLHVCLVFKAMGPDLSVYRRQFPHRQLPVKLLKQVSRQLLLALVYIHRSCKIIHTDIKPQNILAETNEINQMFQFAPTDVFQQCDIPSQAPDDYYIKSSQVASAGEDLSDPRGFSVRLSDFGTASWSDMHLTEWIQPQSLRAPEVILQAGWNWSVDIWNLGCVLWELAEGKVLFDGRPSPSMPYSSMSHLAQMQALFGPVPSELIQESSPVERHRNCQGNLDFGSQFPPCSLDGFTTNSNLRGEERTMFLDFIKAMLKLNPNERLSAEDLLKMAWVERLS